MANPFLVLGGVAVGVITAGIGVLAVPGWISSAQDSAAMNDLGSIRGAESASILQLGEYTDDFDVLESGELGVKFQKSDGVTLIGLKADSNESWCASVQSQSGKFFASSNVTARIATGPGAESAMTTAGCDPVLVDAIIEDALDGTGPGGPGVSVGTPGTGGGSWVGGGGSSEAGGGGTDVDPASLGPVASLGSPWGVTYTSHGVYAVNMSKPDNTGDIVRSGDDGRAHSLTITGDAAGAAFWRITRLDADARGNLYAIGHEEGTAIDDLYRIAPDHSSVDITPEYEYTGEGMASNPRIYGFATSPSGAVYYVGSGAPSGTYASSFDGWAGAGLWKQTSGHKYELVTLIPSDMNISNTLRGMDVDDAGNVVLNAGSKGINRITPGGEITQVTNQLPDGSDFSNTYDIAVSADGSTMYTGTNNQIIRIARNGDSTVAALQDYSEFGENGPPENAWTQGVGITVDPAGNVYFADTFMGGRVLKLAGNGDVTVVMKD